MGIVTNMVLGVVHLVLVAIDVGILLAVLRICHRQWPTIRWLTVLDAACQPLTQAVVQAMNRPFGTLAGRVGQRVFIAPVCLVVLLLLRTVVAGIARGLGG